MLTGEKHSPNQLSPASSPFSQHLSSNNSVFLVCKPPVLPCAQKQSFPLPTLLRNLSSLYRFRGLHLCHTSAPPRMPILQPPMVQETHMTPPLCIPGHLRGFWGLHQRLRCEQRGSQCGEIMKPSRGRAWRGAWLTGERHYWSSLDWLTWKQHKTVKEKLWALNLLVHQGTLARGWAIQPWISILQSNKLKNLFLFNIEVDFT